MIDEVSIQFSKCTTGMHGDDGLWKWCMVVRVVCDGGNGAHFALIRLVWVMFALQPIADLI